jgi:hypothetical protein|tara:strand:+ start:610 stop:1287 length:678 start_codon:yes stop_codon:yes gene_type:complete
MKIISYHQLTTQEGGLQVQKGMNFGVKKNYSIVLMSTAKNAPYVDEVFDDGVIEYEGHDAPKSNDYNKKMVDQPAYTKTGRLTENGKFLKAVDDFKKFKRNAAKIQVYRKIKPGVWVDMGFYDLMDGYQRNDGNRNVFKFLLNPIFDFDSDGEDFQDIVHDRQIPGDVQREVYERDKGQCTKCGSTENLHFDHIIPFSKGGSSKTASNIQLLCAKHNLKKGAKFV